MERNVPETTELDVRSPAVEVEGVEILGKDRTELAVVKEMDGFVVKVDFDGASTETDEPH